ncbi:uncharacterized protein LOC131160897 [Malania oleifera]|uniref:uncharacterized protein LOC131160897 n=1 Tax=Malania oleifera TaxID=397392 RepID=UPI0025AE4B30|nr:uncharacterized protein LOC131160897 [Malania oleifera]
MEKMLAVLPCTDAQKVIFATFKLTGEVKRWWQAVKLLEEKQAVPADMTWSRFKELFYNRMDPKGNSAHASGSDGAGPPGATGTDSDPYAAKFMELSRFAPFMVPDEFQKARWFERGLKPRIHEQVAVLKVRSFSELVDRATMQELSL